MIDLTTLIVILVILAVVAAVAYFFWHRSHPGKIIPMVPNPNGTANEDSARVYRTNHDAYGNDTNTVIPGSTDPNVAANPLNPLNPGLPYNPNSPYNPNGLNNPVPPSNDPSFPVNNQDPLPPHHY
jgi:hypothetical protein